MRAMAASKAAAPRASSRLRQRWASSRGTTMYRITEVNNVSQGTVMAEIPSSRPTMGAKAKIMMVSFKATWDRVK